MKFVHFSKPSTIVADVCSDVCPTDDPIHLFTQFFVHRDPSRHKEIQFCLRKNVENPLICTIHLLVERIYTSAELGHITLSNKIIQTVIGRRLRFQDVFAYIRINNIQGYHVLLNSDICFADDALINLRKSDIHLSKKMYALLRFEYNLSDPSKSPIFGPRFDSQDTWIFHSNFPIMPNTEKVFGFEFGKPGCDNKFIYLIKIVGYEIINDPFFIRTYHVHKSQIRDYSIKDVIQPPWGAVVPAGVNPLLLPVSLGINLRQINETTRNFQDLRFEDNDVLHDYISNKIQAKQPFILPRISGIENNIAVFGRILRLHGKNKDTNDIFDYIQTHIPKMKKNAGIKLSSIPSVFKYAELYLSAFDHCEMFAGWDIQGSYITHISQSHEYIKKRYESKKMIWTMALDIFHYIHYTPWTFALKGLRILIISPFEDTLREKIPIRAKIYGIDLFPDCTITTIRPPQTQASEHSDEFDIELERFKIRLDAIRHTYDVALVSCGGYANPVCAYLYETGKSSIYVGGVLQMYFGILGQRWLKERPDVVRLYLNEHWSRPKEYEKPMGYAKVEDGCYW